MIAYKRFFLPLLVLWSAVSILAAATGDGGTCPVVKMRVEQLPHLQVPRSGHATLCINGELMVIGGHTSGFVPTPTAECFHDGEWHLVPTVYSHDQGLYVPMKSGEIIAAGGHEQALGIGQTFPLEICYPERQSFEGYGCLETKRCFAQGLEMDSGRVIITGNWYNADNIECYDGSRQCVKVKDVSQQRSQPYILRTAKDNAIIFGDHDNYGHQFDTIVVDRLRGEPFIEALLQTWRPYFFHSCGHVQDGFIGDESRDEYAYLLLGVKADGQMAILKTEGERFSLLPTVCPVPTNSPWGSISYFSSIIADRQTKRAYVAGFGADKGDHRLYVLSIDYGQTPAALTLHYSEPQNSIGCYHPVLTTDGNLLMAGGAYPLQPNNYTPSATSLLLQVGSCADSSVAPPMRWLWWVLLSLVLVLAATALFRWYRKKHAYVEEAKNDDSIENTTAYEILLQRICQLMEKEQPYLNSELKVADVAKSLGTNASYISACVNALRGCSFNQFVNSYRIDYAKKLLRQHPDKKVSEVWALSGFANETSFFRTFKAMTGQTPTEWRAQID